MLQEYAGVQTYTGKPVSPVRTWRLILADDHAILLDGLGRILRDGEFQIVAEVKDGRSLVTAATDLDADLIITDFTMPVLDGLEASREILRRNPQAKILMLTMHHDATHAVEAWQAGLRGYLLKSVETRVLVDAIRKVLDGQFCFEPSMMRTLANSALSRRSGEPNAACMLTQRQREVLKMLAEGKQPKQIAGVLGISVRTVEFHKYRVMQALQIHSVPELAVYAVRRGIIG